MLPTLMDIAAPESTIIQRTLDLCQAIAEQPDFIATKERFDAFLSDESLKFRYQQLNEMGQLLQMKQADGLELKPEEIAQFETLREDFLGNPVAQQFLDAQQQMQKLHQTIGKMVDKTFELGRPPTDEELQEGGCCGGGCGCG
jgi:cell fate (sporulation/competence/biofilm development) regulator YlbF (YheA/YmcA/DUF963 family)